MERRRDKSVFLFATIEADFLFLLSFKFDWQLYG